MPIFFDCLYLSSSVEVTDEREDHILSRHRDLGPSHLDFIRRTLLDPDAVHRSTRSNDTLLFSRWYDQLRGGKYLLIAVVGHP
jgi:hypothetical protein